MFLGQGTASKSSKGKQWSTMFSGYCQEGANVRLREHKEAPIPYSVHHF